ncbi:MAG: hypothetical protein ACYTG6_00350 [Planctomycetota bacterium]|jgi:hypothetical protein
MTSSRTPSFRVTATRVFVVLSLIGLALSVTPGPAPVFAQGGSGTGAPPPAQAPSNALGAKFFDDAIRYVARGQAGIPQVRDFYIKLDAKLDLDNQRHEGPMRLWFQSPTLYRQELTINNGTTTKILNGDQGWIINPQGRTQVLIMTAEGRQSISQLKEDRARLSDITRFLTLQALKGPGVTFSFDGYRQGSGTYAGNWIKLTRRVEGRSNILFWLAYARDQGGNVIATWPGIVRVEGDAQRGYPTEDYILKGWDDPRSQQRTFRYPRTIEAYSILRDPAGRSTPARFLYATVDDIKINAGIDGARFQPPARQPGR